MSSYRFCRTDDIGLLVDALNRCWAPHYPAEPPATAASFKRSIRDLQVWCSSCMVAFSNADPVGVLIGAKQASGTLINRIAVHPDHCRLGHARHILTSLGSKLAILGPPRIVAEVPEALSPACALFEAAGYVQESALIDYVLDTGPAQAPELADRFLIPVTVDDLAANGLLQADAPVCWARSVETLTARKDDIQGLAVASDERIEAYVLFSSSAAGPDHTAEILALRSFEDDGGDRLSQPISRLRVAGVTACTFAKVHPAEASPELLATLGFRAAGTHRRYATTARPA